MDVEEIRYYQYIDDDPAGLVIALKEITITEDHPEGVLYIYSLHFKINDFLIVKGSLDALQCSVSQFDTSREIQTSSQVIKYHVDRLFRESNYEEACPYIFGLL